MGRIRRLIAKSKAVSFLLSSFYGFFVYRRLNFFFSNNVLLVNPFPGIGDIFLIARHIPEYLEKNHIKKYKFVVCTDSIVNACSMYPDLRIRKVSRDALDSLIRNTVKVSGYCIIISFRTTPP